MAGAITESTKIDFATFQKQLAVLSAKDDLICSINIIGCDEIKRRYNIVLKKNPSITQAIDLSSGFFMHQTIVNTKSVIGTLHWKNVLTFTELRMSLYFKKCKTKFEVKQHCKQRRHANYLKR